MSTPKEKELEVYKDHLLTMRIELEALEQDGQQGAETVELDQSRVGRLSRMDALQAQAMSQAGNRRRQQELQRIASALQRLEEGRFGDCVRCGEPIAAKRLEVDPSVLLCIECASEAESKDS